jgi:hypothetical protein
MQRSKKALDPGSGTLRTIKNSVSTCRQCQRWAPSGRLLDGGHVEPVHVLQPVDLVVLLEQAIQTSVSYIVYINSVIITK